MLEYGAGNIQQYFYRIIQTSRDTFWGSICVGSCAIYRRKALDSIGGTAQVEHSEDVHTGFRLVDKGWRIKYIPMPLSKWVCPDDLTAYFKQQTRWCTGSMSMLTNPKFWKSKVPRMTKLCYITGFMYYISNPVKLLLIFQSIFLIFFHADTIGFWNLIIFVPTVISSMIVQGIYIYPRTRIWTIIAHASNTWFYSYAVLSLLIFGHIEWWSPTGLKQKINMRFMLIFFFAGGYVCGSIFSVLIVYIFWKINLHNIYVFPVLFWYFIAIAYHITFWGNGIRYFSKIYAWKWHLFMQLFLWIQKFVFPWFMIACLIIVNQYRL